MVWREQEEAAGCALFLICVLAGSRREPYSAPCLESLIVTGHTSDCIARALSPSYTRSLLLAYAPITLETGDLNSV